MPPTLTRSQLGNAVRAKLWETDSDRYFRDVLKVQDEHGKIIPFVRNPHQIKIRKAIDEQRERGEPVRIINLKPRKTGSSTESSGDIYHAIRFLPADALIVANDFDTSEYLFGITEKFYDHSPENEKGKTKEFHKRGLAFARRRPGGAEGRILVETAGKGTVGRGFTPLYLLCSEMAYYNNSEKAMNSLLNSVPDTPESMVIIESTANGMGGYFYDMWQKAKSGESSYKAIFLSWAEFPKYSKPVHDPIRFEATLTAYEKQIQSKYKLNLEQLNWRRHTIINKCGGDPLLFRQEYPLNDVEAFLTSGRSRFDRDILAKIEGTDPLRGFIQVQETYGHKDIVFIPNRDGYISVWKRPVKGKQYVIGSDVAEGIEIEGAPSDDRYDNSSGDVLEIGTGEQVAHIHGKFEPDEFGRQLALLGQWYNWAFQGVERNSNGLTVINEMGHQKYPEALIYSRTHDPFSGAKYSVPQKGWVTSVVTRNNLINFLAQAVRQRSFLINSRETVRELMTMVIKPNGKFEAQAGSKDDRVFSLGIAGLMLQHVPAVQKIQDQNTMKPTPYRHFNSFYERNNAPTGRETVRIRRF